MIILPSPLLGKVGTLNVKYMHDFHLKGYICSDILFRIAILVSCHLYLILYILSTLSVLTPPFLWGLRFMPAGVDAQLSDPPAQDIYSADWESSTVPEPSRFGTYIFVQSFARLWVWWGPVPSSFTNELLEVCGHYVGCIYMFWIMVWTWFVWDVRLYKGSLVGCIHHCVLCSGSLVGLRMLLCFGQWRPCRLAYVVTVECL